MKKKIINLISQLLMIISLIFVGLKLKNFNMNFSVYANYENLGMLIISIIIIMLSVIFLSIGWTKILRQVSGKNIKYEHTMQIYIKTNLSKYIPGNIMQFVGRNLLGTQYGIIQKILTLSTMYELGILTFLGIFIILITGQLKNILKFILWKYILLIIMILFTGVILVMVLVYKKNIPKIKVGKVFGVFKNSFINYLVALVFMGISFVIVALTVYEYDIKAIDLITWVGMFVLAWFVGFITPGAPGGIGIREAILITYMNRVMPSQYILQAVLIHRIINVIADLLLYICCIIFNWIRGNKSMVNEQPQGNYYDKYGSNNKIVIKLMNGFFNSLDECLNIIRFNNVVEAGCGEGKVTNHIYKTFKCNIEGFDIGEDAINKARNDFKEINFEIKSIYDLEYERNSFDLVVCCEVLEHLDEYRKALDELVRISNKYVLISVPCEPIWRVLNLCRLKYINNLGNTPGHINHWSKKSIINLLSEYGNIIDVKTPLPWTVILLEKR